MCHVLIIEDEPLIADIICDFLTMEGASSFAIAATEAEACRLADIQTPVVITSDVRLGDGWGPNAVAAIRATHGDIPTIFITAIPGECKPCEHATAVLSKPFSYDALANALSRAWPNSAGQVVN